MLGGGERARIGSRVSAAASRPPFMRWFNVPVLYAGMTIAAMLAAVLITGNPFWAGIGIPLISLARWAAGRDYNRPRVWWLNFRTGVMFAERHQDGTVSFDPLGDWK